MEIYEDGALRIARQIQEDEETALRYYLANPADEASEEPDLEEGSCCVCWERKATLFLEPCLHRHLCEVCVTRLWRKRCPTCRDRVYRAHFGNCSSADVTTALSRISLENGFAPEEEKESEEGESNTNGRREPPCAFGEGPCRLIRDIMREKREKEEEEWKGALQILLVGSPKEDKRDLIATAVGMFHLDRGTIQGSARGCLHPDGGREVHTNQSYDTSEDDALPCYRANAMLDGSLLDCPV
eukprot:CAMPEP_0184689466 /NCGR_PEP_ID=MMETSP0312-20130426/30673_1 /TAXON_ID=31354 /ORGANISM="Compsopogon coeruleus, Strain SAG 36.94" /LENGTH=241 /DNA_ID=CAMNT_0027146819 /DNA_START=66 /DNA_END=792 /DNA_ORIENTATION=+